MYLEQTVPNLSGKLIRPQYGSVNNADFSGGQFVFVTGLSAEPSKIAKTPAPPPPARSLPSPQSTSGQSETAMGALPRWPSPASFPGRSYLVFFDRHSTSLTDRARQIIEAAADTSTTVQYSRIEVNGYTDTSQSPVESQGISMETAKAVATELVKDGVPKTAISLNGFGSTHLLVPTGAGVGEPQNRRVEIVIR